ncbi:MAG: hypothetical protein ABIH72_00505 [archaeon]
MKLLRDKRAALKFSMLIVGIFTIILVGAYSVSVIGQDIPVGEADTGVIIQSHDSYAELEPEWSVPSVDNDYTVKICNDGPDTIDEVRVYKNELYGGFDDSSACEPKTGWELNFINTKKACFYVAESSSYYIDGGECQDFEFHATAPSEDPVECLLQWKFETRDINDVWHTIYDTTSIDSHAPETTKTLGNPFYTDGTSEWISTSTPVTLTAVDMSLECAIGLDKTWYMNVIDLTENSCKYPDRSCTPITEFDTDFIKKSPRDEIKCVDEVQEYCIEEKQYEPNTEDWYDCVEEYVYGKCEVDPLWKLYRGVQVTKDEESCHIFQYFSVDYLGNAEEYQVNCFFVDDTPPVVDIEVGEPSVGCGDLIRLVVDDDGPEDCYVRDHVTPITLTCEDQGPHPSDNVKIYYRIFLDDVLAQGWALYDEPIIFNEDSEHTLEYYCVDAVDNYDGTENDPYSAEFKVDSQPPIIEKDMLGEENIDWMGDCPSGRYLEHGDCYVADNGRGGVSISVKDDDEQFPQCVVDNIKCNYTLYWQASREECAEVKGVWDDWCLVDSGDFTDYQEIIFHEDSTHQLDIYCEDALGNPIEDHEFFLVDSTPPVTAKVYGVPFFPEDINDPGAYPHFITSDSLITLNAKDAKVGVDKTYWRYIVVEDIWCQSEFSGCMNYDEDILEEFVEYKTPVTLPEDSCHLIEFYSVDLLGNEETYNRQCVFVDNKAPESIKKIGEPKVQSCNNDEPLVRAASVGDVVHELDVSLLDNPGYPHHCSVGLTFDGNSLYYDNCGDSNIYEIDPINGDLRNTFDTGISYPNAMAYDSKRNGIWFGSQSCVAGEMPIYFWDFDDDSVTLMFNVPDGELLYYCFTDGLAYNENDPNTDADDEIWFSDDVDDIIGLFRPDGTLVDTYNPTTIDSSLSRTSGLAVGGPNLYLGNNGGGDVFRADIDSWTALGEFASTSDRVEDMACDPVTFYPTEVMWVRHTPQSNPDDDIITAHEIEPGTCGLGGQPPQCDGETYITQDTLIGILCTDQLPHPVGGEALWYRYRYAEDCDDLELAQWTDWIDPAGELKEFKFPEDSCHELEYYCEDALGNEEEHQFEIDIVDSQAPVIEKEIIGPWLPCDGLVGADGDDDVEPLDCFYIDGITEIHVTVTDPEPHPVNNVDCNWEYYLDGSQTPEGGESNVGDSFIVQFPEESEHLLVINCWDALGNKVIDEEIFNVDKTPPAITKTYGDPYYSGTFRVCDESIGELSAAHGGNNDCIEYWAEWINSETLIKINIDDAGDHKTGIKEVKYRSIMKSNESCRYEQRPESSDYDCSEADDAIGEEWDTAELDDNNNFEFTIDDDSCHLIEIMATDNVDKCNLHKQWVYVDNQSPIPIKTVDEPSTEWQPVDVASNPLDPDATHFYPEIVPLCWNGLENSIDCWKVTLDTKISMECEDPQPHPVNHEKICFKVEMDGEDITNGDGCGRMKCGRPDGYCAEYGGKYNRTTGYCCTDKEIEDFKFLEESEHNLAFYCEDALGNQGPVDDEKFKVIGKQFKIRLNDKWNLISVPFRLLNDDPAEVFEDAESVQTVWSYDENGDWHVYRPDQPELADLDHIVPGEGYWVLSDCEQFQGHPWDWRHGCGKDGDKCEMLTVGGSLYNPGPVVPPSKELPEGWNLIGYYGTEDRWKYEGPNAWYFQDGKDAYCELYSLRNLGGLDPTKWSALIGYWEPENPNAWEEYGFCDELDPGAGYWISMDAEGDYKPSTVCEGMWNSLCQIPFLT